jgi:hypothetical protein
LICPLSHRLKAVRAASSSTAVHSCLLTLANRSGTSSTVGKSIRRFSSATLWNRLTAGSSRCVCPDRWAKE